MAKTSARGSFNIFWGLAISTIISAISLVILGQILEPAEYGIVAIALVAPQFITIFTDLGINSAIVKYTAQFRAEDKSDQIKKFLTSGIAFQVI